MIELTDHRRRILLDGVVTEVRLDDDDLVAADGRRVAAAQARHLPPAEPSKIIAVHLNHSSRVQEFQARLPAAPTYFHKPVSSLNSHGGSSRSSCCVRLRVWTSRRRRLRWAARKAA